jgi:DNA-binding transcriptional ArsR family regulator
MSTTRIARQGTGGLTPEQRAKIFKALSDERRIDIVDALAKHGSQCGTQLAEELGISLALVCHHWEVLVEAGLVKKERQGQLRICTLNVERLAEATGTWNTKPAKVKAPKPGAKKNALAATKRPQPKGAKESVERAAKKR